MMPSRYPYDATVVAVFGQPDEVTFADEARRHLQFPSGTKGRPVACMPLLLLVLLASVGGCSDEWSPFSQQAQRMPKRNAPADGEEKGDNQSSAVKTTNSLGSELASVGSAVQARFDANPTLVAALHYLRLRDVLPQPDARMELAMAMVTGQNPSLGSIVRTRTGFHFRFAPGIEVDGGPSRVRQEAHLNQALATLGELGIHGEVVIVTGSTRGTVGDLVTDLVANYWERSPELEWTAIALLRFHARNEWSNKYGEKSDFDRLAAVLMARFEERSSCANLHLLQALFRLRWPPAGGPDRLTPSRREQVARFVDEQLRLLQASQHPEGYWLPNWRLGKPGLGGTVREKEAAMATSHVLELFLEIDAASPANPLHHPSRAACAWLRGWLSRSIANDTALQSVPFCTLTHAYRSVSLFGG